MFLQKLVESQISSGERMQTHQEGLHYLAENFKRLSTILLQIGLDSRM